MRNGTECCTSKLISDGITDGGTRFSPHRLIVGDSRLVNADVRSAATLAPR